MEEIATHIPAPRPFVKGEPVLYVGRRAAFLAQDGEFAWVEWTRSGHPGLSEGHGTVPLAMLEHADEGKCQG